MPSTFAPRATRMIEIFEHQRARAFGQHETVAVLGERLRRLLRRIVLGRQRGEQRKANQRFRRERTVGADRERGLAFAAPYRLDAELDRGRAGGACRGQRDRRAFGAEMLGEMLTDDAIFQRFVDRRELRLARNAHQVGIAGVGVGSGLFGHLIR